MDMLQPVFWYPRLARRPAASAVPAPAFRSVTIMLTEFCNLDCWMCDFGRSHGLRAALPWKPEEYVAFLRHRFFAGLRSISFTGGEPFAYAGVQELFATVQEAFPQAFLSFSTNATLWKPMSETFALVRNWRRTRLITSIDGVTLHDVQRGLPGAFQTTMGNLARMRERFPELGIDVKFTITPINFQELRAAYEYCSQRGFDFTAKMIENNPYYTNRLSSAERVQEFAFTEAQRGRIGEQLDAILATAEGRVSPLRLHELQELRASLAPEWRREGRCSAPTGAVFLDSRLNLFCCKEYPPVLNLRTASLDVVPDSPVYREVVAHESANEAACARCTSQLKRTRSARPWSRWLR